LAYHQLKLPSGVTADVEKIVWEQLEPHLIDVHSMFRLPVRDDPGLQGGCNFTIAQVLMAVISGASVTLYDPTAINRRGDRKRLFRDILTHHYPWKEESGIDGGLFGGDAATKLYVLFRSPLAHALGIIEPDESPTILRAIVEKGPFVEAAIEETERAAERPADWTHPTLRQNGDVLILWLRSFYWGVRRTIENVVAVQHTRRSWKGFTTCPPLRTTEWTTT
jgi:hypothetical protein